jgi:hypothetical protein
LLIVYAWAVALSRSMPPINRLSFMLSYYLDALDWLIFIG